MRGRDLMKLVRAGAADGVNESLDDLAMDSGWRIPRESGQLAQSDRIAPARSTERNPKGRLAYTAPHAAAQHEGGITRTVERVVDEETGERGPVEERIEFEHYTTPGTGPKFLEAPLREMAGDGSIARNVARGIRARLAGTR